MKNIFKEIDLGSIIGFIFLGLIIFVGIKIALYQYNDCLKVGHAGMYCILNFGR